MPGLILVCFSCGSLPKPVFCCITRDKREPAETEAEAERNSLGPGLGINALGPALLGDLEVTVL